LVLALAAWIADAFPRQSYIVKLLPLVVVTVTARHVLATIDIAALDPARVSPGAAIPPPSAITHRRWPDLTSDASHDVVTELSRPENPPRPATLAFEDRITAAAELWLATPTVPPPWAAA
jgi:hypothetical protein